MPRYNTFRYGRIARYGRYNLVGTSKAIGPYIRYHMRNLAFDSSKTPFIIMGRERINVPSDVAIDRWRIKANNGEWTYMQTAEAHAEIFKVRIRSLESDGGYSPWVIGERGKLQSQ